MKQNSTSKSVETTVNKPDILINSRRNFIKKAAYAAPTLLALGALTRPIDAKAGFDNPPSGPIKPPWG